jgi:DNA-binding IscR family transcriptional regulator
MYLSRPAEYALRAMTYLARTKPDERVRARDLAKALDAQKGHNGGFMLSRPASEIRFIDVLRAVDFQPETDHCLFGLGNCNAQNPCPLHFEWAVLKEQIEHWARSHSLADSD